MHPHRLFLILTAVFLLGGAHARGTIFTYAASLSGANEDPPIVSGGTGVATVTYNDSLRTLRVEVTFSGLTGTTTAAHIHGPTSVAGAGTASVITTTPSFIGFPAGVTSGTYDNTLNLTLTSSWNPTFLALNGGSTAVAEGVLAAALADGKAYLNIHTNTSTSGEIRGFLAPGTPAARTPDTGTTAGMLGIALFSLVALRRKQA